MGTRTSVTAVRHKKHTVKLGGGKRDRTADLLHAMQALSQLSYTPERLNIIRAAMNTVKFATRIEYVVPPATVRAQISKSPNDRPERQYWRASPAIDRAFSSARTCKTLVASNNVPVDGEPDLL